MKSPFEKFRDLAVCKHSKTNEGSSFASGEESEDILQGMQDVEDMRLQYEGLLTNANIISGAAYDFSRSVEDMASFMMKTFGQFIDEEIGNVFSMLAKVQFEISKFLDLFAAHVSQTIISPTEMMMSELQQVQVMREKYDEKRQEFNLLQKEMQKQNPRSRKTESTYELVMAHDEYKETSQILSFRLQSLKRGQSKSLITQAARYHSAQMHLFSKGLASITAMEPVMRQLALEKHIDRSFSEGDIVNSISFDDGHGEEVASKNGAESESLTSSPTVLDTEEGEMMDFVMVVRKIDPSSKSAPISSATHYQREASSQVQGCSTKKVSMYALPSPSNVRGAVATQTTVKFSELTNDGGDAAKKPKMSRSFSHSGPITSRRIPASNNKRQNLIGSSSIFIHTEQIDPLYKSGPVYRSPMHAFIPHTSHVVPPTVVSPPLISELHKLPLPPSPPKSASLVAHSAPLGKKAQDSRPLPKSGKTSPLPPPLSGAVFQGSSVPAASSRLPKWEEKESMNSTQRGFSSPPLKPLVLPVTTSML